MANFPKTLFVRSETDEGVTYFVADRVISDSIEGDGPTKVACYRLEWTKEYRKIPQLVVEKES